MLTCMCPRLRFMKMSRLTKDHFECDHGLVKFHVQPGIHLHLPGKWWSQTAAEAIRNVKSEDLKLYIIHGRAYSCTTYALMQCCRLFFFGSYFYGLWEIEFSFKEFQDLVDETVTESLAIIDYS